MTFEGIYLLDLQLREPDVSHGIQIKPLQFQADGCFGVLKYDLACLAETEERTRRLQSEVLFRQLFQPSVACA